jgi:hypothetical protein
MANDREPDRRLLELAANAAGFIVGTVCETRGVLMLIDGKEHNWNPLADDGDALRLLNKLDLELRHVHFKAHAGWASRFWKTEPHGDDKDAATRRAIVRAAASIGEQEPQP